MRHSTLIRSTLLAALVLTGLTGWSIGAPVRDGNVEVELVADVAGAEPGASFTAAVRFRMDPGWHAYWLNPGSPGFPPSVSWELPEGFKAGELQFPAPHHFPFLDDVSYGYEGEFLLLTRVTTPEGLKVGEKITLNGKVNWLACEKTCIPGGATLSLELPVVESAEPSGAADQIAETKEEIPRLIDWKLSVEADTAAQTATVTIDHGGKISASEGLYFYLRNEGFLDAKKEPAYEVAGDELKVTLFLKKDSFPEQITGVLTSEAGFGSAASGKAVMVSNDPAVSAEESSADSNSGSQAVEGEAIPGENIGFFSAIFGAFIGGLILNVMPCVFPVISLKILGFVQQSGEDKKKIRMHGIWFALGVIIFFWILVSILVVAKLALGTSLGWGYQLQNPIVVMGLILLLFLIALNFFGVFEIGTSIGGVGGKLTNASGYAGSFWNGALAVILATPCTAPFMGVAIGYAMVQPPVITYLVFTSLALGMAIPYLILSFNPELLKVLPKPGAWMETFKQIMAFPMLAVAIWLFRVLTKQIDVNGMTLFLSALLAVAAAAWWFGSFGQSNRGKGVIRLAQIGTVVLALGSLVLILRADDARLPSPDRDVEAVIAAHQKDGKKVFVDFTAEWCLTCQANKLAMHSDKVEAAFKEKDVEFVEVDWTQQDPEILKILQKYKREGVPLYLLFDDDPAKPPRVLPNLLTREIILENLEKL